MIYLSQCCEMHIKTTTEHPAETENDQHLPPVQRHANLHFHAEALKIDNGLFQKWKVDKSIQKFRRLKVKLVN